jgi:hypothetical protein
VTAPEFDGVACPRCNSLEIRLRDVETPRLGDETPLQVRDARRVVPRGHPRRQAAPLLPQLRSPHRHRAEPPAADVDHGVGQMIGVLLLACGLGAALVAWRNRR